MGLAPFVAESIEAALPVGSLLTIADNFTH
jgi:hypothetical protein